MKARHSFEKSTTSKVKCAAGMNVYSKRIKLIDKNNKHADFPMCNAE